MGEIADMMLDGDLCMACGEYMEGGDGYPRTCGGCSQSNRDTQKDKASVKTEQNRRKRKRQKANKRAKLEKAKEIEGSLP